MANSGVVVVVAGQDNTEAVFKQIESNLRGVTERANETSSALEKIGERGVRLLEYFAVEEAALEALSAVKELVDGSLELGEAMEKASQKTGLSVGTLSTLHYAAAVTSSDFDAMSQAVARLDQSIGKAADGDRTAQSFMQSLGLNAKQLASQTDGAEIAFKKFTQTIAATENPIERVRLATGLLGRAGADQLDMLVKIGNNWDFYKEKATEAGVQLDGKTAESLAATNQRLLAIQQSVHGAGIAFTEGFIPGLNAALNAISGGKGTLEVFRELGEGVGHALEHMAAAAYRFAAAREAIDAIGDMGSMHSSDRDKAADEWKRVDELNAKAREYRDLAWGVTQPKQESAAPETPSKGKPFTGAPVPDGAADKLAAAVKARDAAMTRLDEESAQLAAQRAKANAEAQLAALEDEHKKNLISDKDYYAQKLAIQQDEIAKEKQAAMAKQDAIDTQIDKLSDDAKKQTGAKAVEDQAKMLDLQGRQLAIAGQIAALDAASSKARLDTETAIYELEQKRLQTSDELAAKRQGSNGNVGARLKQSADTYADQRRGLVANYGSGSVEVANADAAQATDQNKIRATGADESYGVASARIDSQRSAVDDAAQRGAIGSAEAQRERIALDAEEADALKPVLAAYEQLAKDGDLAATEKVIQLQTQIRELDNPVDEVAAHMRESFDGAFEGLFDNLDKGTKDLQDFGKQVEKIFLSEAYRRIVEPGVQQALGSIFPNGGGNGPAPASNPIASVGGIGKALGGLIPGINKIPGVGISGGKGGDVSVQIINQGSPVESGGASQSKASDDGGFESRVVSIILKDAETNGSVVQALAGALRNA